MTNINQPSDARRCARVQSEIRAKITYLLDTKPQLANGRLQDISEGGIGVYAPVEFEIGSTVEIEFSIPRIRAPFRVHAVVRNRLGFRYGLEFQAISKVQRDEIAKFAAAVEAIGASAGEA